MAIIPASGDGRQHLLLGFKPARCPGCGGNEYAQVPTVKLRFRVIPNAGLDMRHEPVGCAYLCANPECNLRVLQQEDLVPPPPDPA